MNGVFAIIAQAGAMCLLGLGMRHPVRGSVEIGWGVELAPGEIYGAIVARAYELESLVAGYPRIVVGRTVYEFLRSHADNETPGVAAQIDRELARKCLGMLAEDEDGYLMVDYLGDGFRDAVTKGQHTVLYDHARPFVLEQFHLHRSNLDAKLAPRYAWLLRYFDARAPLAPADA
jgi:plasmid stabilization system protein ParE